MRPVENIWVQGAVPPTLIVDALDADVVVTDLRSGLGGPIAIEHHPADWVQRSQQPRHALAEEDRVLLDGGAKLGVHVLHRTGPRPLQQTAPVAEQMPGQRVRPEGRRWRVVSAGRDRAAGGE